MQEDILVEVNNVSKKFCKNLKRSLWYGAKELAADFMGVAQNKSELRKDEFWAVKDVSFQLRRGECMGLIGHNGAGKSTLLKMLNGLIRPDEGEIRMRGRVGALIELGAGFNPVLTGRENVYVNGQILGFSKKEIDQKFEAIVAFAEIADFIDSPVQNYSSGMKVRLGFAVAAQMEPDILIIDEVLAVGDVGFRAKCYDAIGEISKKSAIIFVSHAMPMIARICSSTILMNNGILEFGGNTPVAIEKYYDHFVSTSGQVLESKGIDIEEIIFYPDDEILTGEDLSITLKLRCEKDFTNVDISLFFMSRELVPVCQISSHFNGEAYDLKKGESIISIKLRQLCFNPGYYPFSIIIEDVGSRQKLLWHHNVKELKVKGENFGNAPYLIQGLWNTSQNISLTEIQGIHNV